MVAAHSSDPPPNRSIGEEAFKSIGEWEIEEAPYGLMERPLEFIFAEHHRQREAASILVLLAEGEFDLEGAQALLAFLETDFALHIGDEELALFPLLREHCLPEDRVERILERLEEEHREDEAGLNEVVDILKNAIKIKAVDENKKRRLRVFAEHVRQHLALENGVLLPIARVRLGKEELRILSAMFKERRQPV